MVNEVGATQLAHFAGEVGHRDMWEAILKRREKGHTHIGVPLTPSHLGVKGNDGADKMTQQGGKAQPHNKKHQ